MKRWAFLTIGLYTVTILLLSAPLLILLNPDEGNRLEFFGGFCVYGIPALALVEGALLLIPVAVVKERPVKRRSVVISALLGAIPMVFMVVLFLWSLLNMVLSENSPVWQKLELPAWLGWSLIGLLWFGWSIVFCLAYRSEDPRRFTSRVTAWLLRGSILETIVAIPTHIIARHRHECCAPPISLFGIVTGLSVALLAFGPSLFFLFARRIKEKNRSQPSQ